MRRAGLFSEMVTRLAGAALATWALLLPAPGSAQVVSLGVTQLTDDVPVLELTDVVQVTNDNAAAATTANVHPTLSGNLVAWEHCEASGGSRGLCRVDLWDGAQRTTLSAAGSLAESPDAGGGQVVWEQCSDWTLPESEYGDAECTTGAEIYLWNGTTSFPLTADAVNDEDPHISNTGNGYVVWEQEDANEVGEVMLWNGAAVSQLTGPNDVDDEEADISGSNVVWSGCDGTMEFYPEWDEYDCNGVYQAYGTGEWFGSITGPVGQISSLDNTYEVSHPRVDGSEVAWNGWPTEFTPAESGWDGEIFYWSGTGEPIQVTNNDDFDVDVRISEGRLLWTSYLNGGRGYALMYWEDGVTQVLRTSPPSGYLLAGAIEGTTVVWSESDYSGWAGLEIFVGTLAPIPEPSPHLAMATAVMSLLWMRRRRGSPSVSRGWG